MQLNSVSDADPDSIMSVYLDPGGQKWPTKIEISWKISYFEVLDVVFWELKDFSFSLDVHYAGLGIS